MKRQISVFFSLFFLAVFAYAASSPVPMLESTANQLISQLQHNKAQLRSNPKMIDGFVKTIVLPHIAQDQMARAVVSRSTWAGASAAEQQQFIAAFRDLVIRTYASAFANYNNETVKFMPLREGTLNKNFVTVNSKIIRAGGSSIPVSYSMSMINGNWKVTDFSVDGVSMVNSFQSQFASLDTGKGLSALTAILQKHNNNAAKAR